MLPMEANLAKEWVEEHYAIIRNDVSWTYKDMLVMGQKMLKRKKYGKFIIEPYNVLEKETSNEHQYDSHFQEYNNCIYESRFFGSFNK